MQSHLKVLLIEDNEDDYELTKALLNKRVVDLVWVQSLSGAKKILAEQNFDAILLDLGIPDSQGVKTLTNLIESAEQAQVIVVLTGNDDESIAKESLVNGAQDYLVKGEVTSDLLMRSLRYAIERNKADAQLRKTNDELVGVNQALVLARDAALDASRLKSEFLANISHEIRTPLSGIVTIAELLMLEKCSPEVTELHKVLQDSAQRLNRTVNDLLDLSKLEAGRMVLNTVDCDIRDLVLDVMLTVEPTAKRKFLTIASDIHDSVPKVVSVDELRLKQILLNLVHNAVKFTESGSVNVTVHCEPGPRNYLRASVKDTGIGIPEKSKRSIFEPFTQADGSTTRRFGGTGLGLAISKKSAELLGGEIGVESEEGQGALFWVRVPVGASA